MLFGWVEYDVPKKDHVRLDQLSVGLEMIWDDNKWSFHFEIHRIIHVVLFLNYVHWHFIEIIVSVSQFLVFYCTCVCAKVSVSIAYSKKAYNPWSKSRRMSFYTNCKHQKCICTEITIPISENCMSIKVAFIIIVSLYRFVCTFFISVVHPDLFCVSFGCLVLII